MPFTATIMLLSENFCVNGRNYTIFGSKFQFIAIDPSCNGMSLGNLFRSPFGQLHHAAKFDGEPD